MRHRGRHHTAEGTAAESVVAADAAAAASLSRRLVVELRELGASAVTLPEHVYEAEGEFSPP